MSYLHDFASKSIFNEESLSDDEKFSVFYHSLFDYPLSFPEIIKWMSKNYGKTKDIEVVCKNGFYFIKGKQGFIHKRQSRERISKNKIKIAKKASKIISIIPSIKMIGLTGSLAMNNAKDEDDIDLIVITKKGRLWSTRLLVYLILKITNHAIREPKDKIQKNKLCLNMWIDESDLIWQAKDRNIYTAHEILQVDPLFMRGDTFKKFINSNRWALKYWPNAVRNISYKNKFKDTKLIKLNVIENLIFKLQYTYMKDKITSEVITSTKAIFHPRKLSKQILSKIRS